MHKRIKQAIQLEKLRHTLSVRGAIEDFIASYKSQLPTIQNINSGSFWDTLNETFETRKDINPMAWNRIQIVKSWILEFYKNKKKQISLLNIGFGSGNLEESMEEGLGKIDWVGIDLSSKSVTKAKIKYPGRKFIIGNFLSDKVLGKHFDIVIALEVLEHISPKYTFKFLSKVNGLLNNNGIFILSVPLNENLSEMLEKGINPNAHVRIYTPEVLGSELSVTGFKKIKSRMLFAFKTKYFLKTLIANILSTHKPNQIIILCKKT